METQHHNQEPGPQQQPAAETNPLVTNDPDLRALADHLDQTAPQGTIDPQREAQLAQELTDLLQSITEKTGIPIPNQPRPWLGR